MSDQGNQKSLPRGSYIPTALNRYCLNGDAFIMIEDAYTICTDGKRPYRVFEGDLAEQVRLGKVHREGRRLYLTKTWRYENAAATHLSAILRDNTAVCPELSADLFRVGEMCLNEEQCGAVRMALSHRLSVILGGAGTGKSTIIKKIVDEYPTVGFVLAAPTGKAARNLSDCAGYQARTVHSALGLHLDDDALSPVIWKHIGLVVVDEASMVTIELLAGLLCKVRKDCRIVLVGDPNQLLSVGLGNVLPDILALGIPCIRLEQNFRQADKETALYRNVVGFADLNDESELCFDDSFRMEVMGELAVEKALVEEAVRRYQSGESVQVLSPYNSRTQLSVRALNRSLQERLNPAVPCKKELVVDGEVFRDGDRVIITRNDHDRHCVNGDVGILRIEDDDTESPVYYVRD